MNSETVRILKEAIEALANYVDSVVWRTATPEEKYHGIHVASEIRAILRDIKEA